MILRIVLTLIVPLITLQYRTGAFAQVGALSDLKLERLMSNADFKVTGLQKLSPEELAALNLWLQQYTVKIVESVASVTTAPKPSPQTPGVIESCIAGDFEGWDGETIFKLDNGQIWQQVSFAYTYRYAYRPKVLIYKSGGIYKMTVEGVTGSITVQRLK